MSTAARLEYSDPQLGHGRIFILACGRGDTICLPEHRPRLARESRRVATYSPRRVEFSASWRCPVGDFVRLTYRGMNRNFARWTTVQRARGSGL